jgi:hypothetical protein
MFPHLTQIEDWELSVGRRWVLRLSLCVQISGVYDGIAVIFAQRLRVKNYTIRHRTENPVVYERLGFLVSGAVRSSRGNT